MSGETCPACGRERERDDLPSVFAANRTVRVELRETTDAHGHWTTYEDHVEVLSPLGRKLEPPHAPVLASHPALRFRFASGVALLVVTVLVATCAPFLFTATLFWPEAWLPSAWLGLSPRVVLALTLLLLGGTSVAGVLAALAMVMRRRYHAAAARHAVESATHERAVRAHAAARAFWEGLRFCACEEVVWDPRTRERFAADMLQRRVRDVGERAVSGRA
ncbi:MAG: hypothetical protein H6726_24970 [Sandaracinaceae bacterium]|nr:hypothetical protein [Sandaracinaceae bacterium]